MDERAPDERTTLEELERLQQQIRHYKAQRDAVDQQFEQFIRSFKRPPEAAGPTPPTPAPPPRVIASPLPASEGMPEPSPAHQVEPLATARVVERAAAPVRVPAPPARRQSAPGTSVLIGGALALLAGGALVTWTLRPRAPGSSTTGTAPPATSAPAVPAASVQPPVTVAPVETELTTTRAVWVRVISDGEKVLERELPPNARVPLKAERTIVIRTGDAGAIRLTLRGQDQGFLGRTGEVVTRTFNVPPPQAGR